MSVEQPRAVRAVLWPLLACLAYVAAMAGFYAFFICTELGQRLDASSFGAVVWLRNAIGPWADTLRLGLPEAAGVLLVVLAIIALARRQRRDAFAAVALSVITLALSTALKDFLVYRPYLGNNGYGQNTFPSGHMAITTSVLIGCYWLLPGRLHKPIALVPLVVLGAASGLFQVAAYAHRPSDVFGGALLAAAVAAIFVGRGGALAVGWRWIFWVLVVVAGAVGTLCLASWQSSGYATGEQVIGTTGILLGSAACVGAAMILGAERPAQHPQPQLIDRVVAKQDAA